MTCSEEETEKCGNCGWELPPKDRCPGCWNPIPPEPESEPVRFKIEWGRTDQGQWAVHEIPPGTKGVTIPIHNDKCGVHRLTITRYA